MEIQGLILEPYILVYIPLIGFITYAIFKATPTAFNEARFGTLVSLVVGVVISLLDCFWHPFGIGAAILRGLIMAAVTSGVYDNIKAGQAWKNGNQGVK